MKKQWNEGEQSEFNLLDEISSLDFKNLIRLRNEYLKEMEDSGDDDDSIRSDINDILSPYCENYAKLVIRKDGAPPDGMGWSFEIPDDPRTGKGGFIDVMLYKSRKGWIPSVRSDWWDAPASSVGSELSCKAWEALAWGLCDALVYWWVSPSPACEASTIGARP
jgi:hypothetical protein